MSPQFKLNKADLLAILKVLGWTVASAIVGFIIATLPQIDVPVQYAAVVAAILPVVNTGLYALQKWIAGEIVKDTPVIPPTNTPVGGATA